MEQNIHDHSSCTLLFVENTFGEECYEMRFKSNLGCKILDEEI